MLTLRDVEPQSLTEIGVFINGVELHELGAAAGGPVVFLFLAASSSSQRHCYNRSEAAGGGGTHLFDMGCRCVVNARRYNMNWKNDFSRRSPCLAALSIAWRCSSRLLLYSTCV